MFDRFVAGKAVPSPIRRAGGEGAAPRGQGQGKKRSRGRAGEGRGSERTGPGAGRARGRAGPGAGRARGRHSYPTSAPSLPWEGEAVGAGCSPSLLAANGSRDRRLLSRVETLTFTLIRSLSSILCAPHRCPRPLRVSGRAGRGSSGLCPRHQQLMKFSWSCKKVEARVSNPSVCPR